jgi:hypothetical protein
MEPTSLQLWEKMVEDKRSNYEGYSCKQCAMLIHPMDNFWNQSGVLQQSLIAKTGRKLKSLVDQGRAIKITPYRWRAMPELGK